MKILSLSVQSLDGNLNIESVTFKSPTLLVGLSGSGKSQILMCIYQLFHLILGEKHIDLADGNYQVSFSIHEKTYHYQTQIRNKTSIESKLWCNEIEQASEHLNIRTLMAPIRFIDPLHTIRRTDLLLKRLSRLSEKTQNEIKTLYQFIFPNIEDIRFQSNQLLFKEKEMNWFSYKQLSDGMLKTFIYVYEIVLAEKGSVLLIDEIENGLGLNCMNVLLEELIQRDDLQFIISSHHPYIINNIPTPYWQIISRKQDVIMSRSSEDFGIGQTRYDAFFELMNGLYYEEDF